MGLPGDVATHKEVQASPPAYPHALRSRHTPTMHQGVNVTFTAGPRGYSAGMVLLIEVRGTQFEVQT